MSVQAGTERYKAHHGGGAARGVLALEDARANKDAVDTELHQEADIGRSGQTASRKGDHRKPAGGANLLNELDRNTKLLGEGEDLVWAEGLQLADLRVDVTGVADGLDDVAGASVALQPDHSSALGDAAESLTEVLGAAHKWHLEGALVNVVRLIGGGEHLRLVDAVHTESLKDLM